MSSPEVKELRNALLKKGKTLFLFDVDGTVTPAGLYITQDMLDFLEYLSSRPNTSIACVTCNNFKNLKIQLASGIKFFDNIFSENGCANYDKNLNNYHNFYMKDFLGEEKFNLMLKYFEEYLSKLELPFVIGKQIDIRTSVINVSPSGNVKEHTPEQRKEFTEFNIKNKIEENMRKDFIEKFTEKFKIRFTKGGANSTDLFPIGCDKTYCLKFIKENEFDNIIFFGDNTYPGGADYDLAVHERVTRGINVKNPQDTIVKVKEILKELDTIK